MFAVRRSKLHTAFLSVILTITQYAAGCACSSCSSRCTCYACRTLRTLRPRRTDYTRIFIPVIAIAAFITARLLIAKFILTIIKTAIVGTSHKRILPVHKIYSSFRFLAKHHYIICNFLSNRYRFSVVYKQQNALLS